MPVVELSDKWSITGTFIITLEGRFLPTGSHI